MSPISYQGPMQVDEEPKRTYSQTEQANLGVNQPGRSVAAIFAERAQQVHAVTPETPVLEAIGELNRLRIGVLVVVDGDGRPLGILSERDVVRNIETKGLALFGLPVGDVMTVRPVTCTPDDPIEKVMRQMIEGQFRHMPVMENDRLCGLVSIRDLLDHRLGELEYENLKIKQAVVG